MVKPLTPRQLEVLKLVADGCERGRAPSYCELGVKLGINSSNGISCHVNACVTKGVLDKAHGARGLSVTALGMKILNRRAA